MAIGLKMELRSSPQLHQYRSKRLDSTRRARSLSSSMCALSHHARMQTFREYRTMKSAETFETRSRAEESERLGGRKLPRHKGRQ